MNTPTTTRTVTETGVELPWERVEHYGPMEFEPHRPPKGTVIESGRVFIPIDTLVEIAEQDRWAGAFGESLVIGYTEKLALVKHGWAVEETRGGVHGTDALNEWLKAGGYL